MVTDAPIELIETPADDIILFSYGLKEGVDGYDFTKECIAVVEGEYLTKTAIKQVSGNLYVVYNGQEEDLRHEASGILEDNGVAELKVKLFYGTKYYDALQEDPKAQCDYVLKKIRHARGEKEIDSEKLEMPHTPRFICQFVEMPGTHFNHNSTVPLIDSKGDFVAAMVAVYIFAKEHSDKELTIAGHTDTSGGEEYNQELSEMRAKTIKAFLDNDRSGFVDLVGKKNKVEDYQGILKVLAGTYGWECDPGAVDNQDGPKTQAALKHFQTDFNELYESSITVDGQVGPLTWGAFFDVMRDMIRGIVSKEYPDGQIPKLKYSSDGAVGYGETKPIDAKNKGNYRSQSNRRVELVFTTPGEKPKEKQPVVMEPIAITP